ncbi:MAG: hypothetical protein Q7U97_05655 [Rhodocyclaceae bacterium]|nr:hypothetical protein [Rhodocyclaceae bacterium]
MSQYESTAPQQTRFIPLSLALIVWSSLALFFLLVSWAAGGDRFKDSIYGNVGLGIMVAVLLAGIALRLGSRGKV